MAYCKPRRHIGGHATTTRPASTPANPMGMIARRALGMSLLLATFVPLHRLLDPARTGPAGVATRTAADAAWSLALLGSGIVLGLAVVATLVVPGARVVTAYARLGRVLERPGATAYALGTGLMAFLLASAAALLVHGGAPTSVDEMAQLLHASALAHGSLFVPTAAAPAAFSIQNGVTTPDGWVSIYPPLHTLALALGLRMGVPWLVGPVAIAVATAASTSAFERLMGRATGRAAGALLSVTPFWIVLGSTHLSHATAAACLSLVAWTATRARDGHLGLACACGAAFGAGVTTRPWITLVCGTVIVVTVWLTRVRTGPADPLAGMKRFAAVVAGGVPFALLLLFWNTRLFGRATMLGYSAAFGPAHGLGFHRDPWGNAYGPLEAIAYTGADLVQLGVRLFESPLPALALIGAALLISRGRPGRAVMTAWIVAAVGANALYWHHGIHMGPRMLFESTPAWVALFVAAASAIGSTSAGRGVGAWCIALTLLGGALSAPSTVSALRDAGAQSAPPLAMPSGDERAIVFAHGSWASRIAARLEASGMRRDSIETALRRNDVCAVDLYARWRTAGAVGSPPAIDFVARPGSPPELRSILLSEGNPVRISPGSPDDDGCRREAASDRLGVVELEPLIWRAPPFTDEDVVVVRDLGPADNAALASLGDRRWYVYVSEDGSGAQRLLDYEAGMELLWRGAGPSPLR